MYLSFRSCGSVGTVTSQCVYVWDYFHWCSCCRFQPVLSQFRNKDEFCVGSSIDGFPKEVGYFVGKSRGQSYPFWIYVPQRAFISSFADNNVIAVSPEHLIAVRDSHKLICRVCSSSSLTFPSISLAWIFL